MFKGIHPVKCFETILTDDFSILKDFRKKVRYKDAHTNEYEKDGDVESIVASSYNRILEHPDLIYVKKTLMYHFDVFMYNFLKVAPEISTTITTSWFARIKKGGAIHNHNHTNSWYSGLLYFDDDYTGAAPLALENPTHVFSHFDMIALNDQAQYRQNAYYEVIPQPNKLFFFPSYIKHMSGVQLADKTRYSLAWNIYPKGKIGLNNSDSYLDTKWLSS